MAHRCPEPVKICLLLACAIFTLLSAPGIACRAEAARQEDFLSLLERRTVNCWPEGAVFDDLVIGARGKLTFFYVDGKLGNALQRMRTSGHEGMPDDRMPRMLTEYAGKFVAKKGHILFVLFIEGYKPWTFDTRMVRVGDYRLAAEDIVRGMLANPDAELQPGENELPGDYMGIVSFYVETGLLKPGSEIAIGYGEDVSSWKVPSRNE